MYNGSRNVDRFALNHGTWGGIPRGNMLMLPNDDAGWRPGWYHRVAGHGWQPSRTCQTRASSPHRRASASVTSRTLTVSQRDCLIG